MSIRLNSDEGLFAITVSGILDEDQGQKLQQAVVKGIPKGGKAYLDGSGLTEVTAEGLYHLRDVQHWISTKEHPRLLLAGFSESLVQMLYDSGVEDGFDPHPTVEEARRVLGVGPAPPTGTKSRPTEPRRIEEPDEEETGSWGQPGKGGRGGSNDPAASTIDPVSGPWSKVVLPGPRPPTRLPGRTVAVVASLGTVAALLGWGVWWLLSNQAPVVTVSQGSITVEEGGNEVEPITAHVARGTLDADSLASLPAGLSFLESEDDPGMYTLEGAAKSGATSGDVALVGVGTNGKRSQPVRFTVTVKSKTLAWQVASLQSLPLHTGSPVKGFATFVTGADAVTASGLPAGLRVEVLPGTKSDWQLAGTPTTAGKAQVSFQGTTHDGSKETQSCVLEVAPALPVAPPAPPVPNPTPVPSPTASPSVSDLDGLGELGGLRPPPDPYEVDDNMRAFLLKRIQKLPSRYNQTDREILRLIVAQLTRARPIYRVSFERDGLTKVSPTERARLKAELESPSNVVVLHDPNCQIVVVGYASTTGSHAVNTRLSRARAKAVDDEISRVLGRNADLCGDYGPTDVLSRTDVNNNRAVEVYAGTLNLHDDQKARAADFKDYFNHRYGTH